MQGTYPSTPIPTVSDTIPETIDRLKRQNYFHTTQLEQAAAAINHFQQGQISQALEIFFRESF